MLFFSGFLIVIFSAYSWGQSATDSFDIRIHQASADSTKVIMLNSEARRVENSDPQKAIAYGKEALSVSYEINYPQGIFQSLNSIGRGFKLLGVFDSALFYFKSELRYQKQTDPANTRSVSTALMNIGTVFRNQGIYDSATIYYHEALKIAEANNDIEIRANCLNNIGNVLRDQQNIDDAITYYLQALDLRTKQKNQAGSVTTLINLGTCFDNKEEYETAMKYYTAALNICSEIDDKSDLAKCYNDMGESLINQGKLSQAEPFLSKALKLQNDLDDQNGMASTTYSLALLKKDIKSIDEAIKLSIQSLSLAQAIGNEQLELDNYDLLDSLYSQKGNFKDAYDNQGKAAAMRDSLFSLQKSKVIDELQTKYETEKKEQQIALLNQENKAKDLQKNIFLIGSIALVLILLALIFIFFQQGHLSRQKVKIQGQRIEKLLRDQEINAYNSMMVAQESERKRIAIDLHDRLGSMLSTIRAYFSVITHDAETNEQPNLQLHTKTTSMLDSTLDELRKISNNLSTGIITTLGLRPAIEELCETISNGSGIDCKALFYNLEERIDTQTEIGIYRIIQELLSNILKHAQAKHVTVQLNKIDSSLQITIEDDGVGFNYQEKIKSPGMGLKNISVRVEQLRGTFHIDSELGRGSVSIVEIPLKAEELHPLSELRSL